MAAGCWFSLVLDEAGAVFGFGANDWGQLGLGHREPQLAPRKLPLPGSAGGLGQRFLAVLGLVSLPGFLGIEFFLLFFWGGRGVEGFGGACF